MRFKRKNNAGYTMIELIIVIAIILIMTGMGALTISSIRTSQANSSMQRFDEELSALIMRTKTQSSDFAIRVVKNDANYEIYYGKCTTAGDDSTFVYDDSTKPDAVLERVTIYYSKTYKSDNSSTPLDEITIQVRKSDGQVLLGYGEYRFCKFNANNTGNTVGHVTLNEYTGSHTYGSN